MGTPSRLSLVVLAAFAAVVLTPVASAAIIVGTNTLQPNADSNPAGVAEAFRLTASASGPLTRLSVYVDTGSTATKLVAGIYSEVGGKPGTLLAQGSLTSPVSAAWNDVTLPATSLSAGTVYWLAILGPAGTLRYRDRCCGGGTPAEVHATRTLTALPSGWTTGARYSDGPVAAYGSSVDSPVLVVTPTSLSFSATEGGPSPPAKQLSVSNGGGGLLSWTATTSATWLTVLPGSGAGPATLNVVASIGGLAAGTYTGSVTVTASGAQGSPATIPVTLTVGAVPPPDTSAPVTAITAPVAGATVSGAVSVTASATDNVGVAGVRFTLDGATLGSEDTTAPYGVSWDTTTTPAGPHVLSAVARDAAGNTTTAAQVAVTVSNSSPPSGLVAAFGFGDGSGTTVTDSSGLGNAGSINGAAWSAAGRFGGALSFDGVNDWVTVPDANSLDLTNAMTLEAWVNPNTLGTTWRTAVLKETTGYFSYALYANTDTTRPSGHYYTGTTDIETRGSSALSLNAWSHLATTYDGATLRIFVNGVQVGSRAATGSLQQSSGSLRLGGNAIWGEWFRGLIDEVRVYNRALTATELQADMSAPIGAPGPDTTAPSVSITAPSAAATVSGSVAVSANAADNVGVSGVQFKLDGANLGAEDLSAPYSTTWDTTAATNGPHTLTAIARDSAGNTTTSTAVSVTVGNGVPDTTPPTVALTAPADASTVSGPTTVSATASDDVGVTQVQFTLDGADLGAADPTAPYSTSWTTTTAANGPHRLAAIARDAAGNTRTAAERTVTVANGGSPDQIGAWTAPISWPLVAVHMSLLPTGNVLAFDGFDDGPNSQRIWNPATQTFTPVPYGRNLFCSGHILLPDGRTLVLGGHVNPYEGLADSTLFNATTNSWSRAPDMAVSRWYPTATELADGRVLVLSGDGIVQDRANQPPSLTDASVNSLPEVYDPASNSWTALTGSRITSPLYPQLFVLSDGRILDVGPDTTTRTLSPIGWNWTTIATSPFDGHSSVMYRPNRIMKSGAWSDVDFKGVLAYQTHGRTAVLDMNQSSPSWRETPAMRYGRGYHNLTLLPDGTVFASGGGSNSDGVTIANAVLPTEIWNPDTETWRETAPLTNGRLYHSTALLLPDGRVLMAGGGQLPSSGAVDQRNAEIYSPPYLFKGARPTIAAAPDTLQYGQQFTVSTPDASRIASVSLIRTPSVTHAFDENQRFQFLNFTQSGNALNVTAPANGNLAPPGYYMLFIVDSNGVPSVASFVRFPAPWEDTIPPGAPGTLTATGSRSAASLSWGTATDNIGVIRYSVYRSSTPSFTPSLTNRVGQAAGTSYTDSGLAAGTYYYRVRAEDAAGNLGPSSNEAAATATGDDVAPTVSITAPANGSTVSGATAVNATATDDVGVVGVQFRLDGANLASEDTTQPYSVSWSTTSTANGAHTLTAVARDASGNATTSAGTAVTVANTAPPSLRVLIGETAVRASADSNAAGLAEAFQYTATASGNLTQASIYVDTASTATTLVAGVYTDVAGRPGALLAQGTRASPTAASWNVVPLPSAALAAGTQYWIAFLSPAGSGTLRFRDACCGNGAKAETSSQTTLTALPATWSSGTAYRDGPASAYASGN